MKSVWMSCLAIALIAGRAGAYESVRDLLQDFQKKQNAALQEYLDAKPDAKDAAEGRQMLVMGYQQSGEGERALPILLKMYDEAAAKGQAAEPRALIGAASGIIQAYAETGKKDEGKAFIERVRKDVEKLPDAERMGQFLKRAAAQLEKPMVGDTVKLQFKAIDGREIDLAAMKDKVVLIDFWATWCGPCRAEMPNVKKTYAELHDKGLEVIGISLDRDREALDKYLKEQEIPWAQHFDGKAWETELATGFGVTGIPATFLIGKDGKLAATNVRGEELGKRVKELLAK